MRALNNNTDTIHLSNLYTKITLPQDKDNIATCNLVSINLSAFLREDKTWDWDRLQEASRAAIRQLDNLIDITETPVKEAMHANQQTRAVGLGMMGFSDVLEKLGYCYESSEAYELIDQLTEYLRVFRLFDRILWAFNIYIYSQLAICFPIGTIVFLYFSFRDLPYAAVFAVVSGVSEFIPVIGPTIASAFCTAMTATISPWVGLQTMCFYLLITQINHNFV